MIAPAHPLPDLRVVLRRVHQTPLRAIDARQAQPFEKASAVLVHLRQRAERMAHHALKGFQPELVAALTDTISQR